MADRLLSSPITGNERCCTRRERPRRRRSAERDQQFPPPDGDCHTPLPREGALKGTIPRHQRTVLALHPAECQLCGRHSIQSCFSYSWLHGQTLRREAVLGLPSKRKAQGLLPGLGEERLGGTTRRPDTIPRHKSGKARVEAPMREARSSPPAHRCVAYLADIARAE